MSFKNYPSMALIRRFLLSLLCGPRVTAATPPLPDVLTYEMTPKNTPAPNKPGIITAFDAVCDGCGRNLSSHGSILFVLGAPGTVTGTQCAFLALTFDFNHLSYLNLCRHLRRDLTLFISRLDVKEGSNNPDVSDDLGSRGRG